MPKPPESPIITASGRGVSYFQELIKLLKPHLEQDGITLNFSGYTDTIRDYSDLEEHDYKKAWTLAKELNAWSEYFSDTANLIQKFYLDSEAEKNEKQAISSMGNDAVKVANGDRMSNMDPVVVAARKKRNALKSFHNELTDKVEFLNRSHYHCKATYDLAMKFLTSSNFKGANNEEISDTAF